jgi:hypothetical protein
VERREQGNGQGRGRAALLTGLLADKERARRALELHRQVYGVP